MLRMIKGSHAAIVRLPYVARNLTYLSLRIKLNRIHEKSHDAATFIVRSPCDEYLSDQAVMHTMY